MVDDARGAVARLERRGVDKRLERRPGLPVRLHGAAWSDGTPIRSVEVRIDEETWRPAQLTPNRDHPHAWTFWSFEWTDAKPGEHTLTSRAVDVRGRIQPAPDDPFIAMKKTYWEANQQAIRKIRIDA